MFNKNVPGGSGKDGIETIIGPSVKIEGNFACQGGIVIEGEVKGSVKTAGYLQIGDKAAVTADVDAKEARIGGEVRGNIKIDGFLDVTASAKIFGDIEASHICVARGAILKGKCAVFGSEAKAPKASKPANGNE